MKTKPNRVLVTGAGRSGTSALMKFFHQYIDSDLLSSHHKHLLRGDHGSWEANSCLMWNAKANAGLEYVIDETSSQESVDKSPYIFKDPRLCISLKKIMQNNMLNVDHLFICIRDYRKSAQSRKNKNLFFTEWKSLRCKDERKSMLRNQIEFNERAIGRLMETVAEYDISHTILSFPRFIRDKEYFFNKLKNTPVAINREDLDSAFSVFDEKQVNY